ncbi:MAG TPA: glycerophosphodiester phosphodiesterase family protein [Puia sp.]|nr:glycerophosphodiester phosphodiesterase family protein [Puia sp.]
MNTKRLSLPGLGLFLLSLTATGQTPDPAVTMAPNPAPGSPHRFLVCAHRGDHTHAPENTLQAYANAIEAGADYVEIDLRTTRDSVLVIMHDASVNRMTTGTGLIREMSWDSLRRLRVREKTHPEWGEYNIPTFDQVLQLCRGKIGIYLDFKNADPAVAYKAIRRYGMEDQVIVYINASQQFDGWRRVAPKMPLMVSLPGNVRTADSLAGFLSKYHPDILDGDWDGYTPEMVTLATKRGYLVFPDIQGPNESPALWDAAVSKGIRALQTDHPTELVAWLKDKRLR